VQRTTRRRRTQREPEVLVRLHARMSIVQKARNEFDEFLLDLEQKHQLTCAEIFSLLGAAVMRYARSLIQMERHPHAPDKGGDEA
jgi:hypothetical protein